MGRGPPDDARRVPRSTGPTRWCARYPGARSRVAGRSRGSRRREVRAWPSHHPAWFGDREGRRDPLVQMTRCDPAPEVELLEDVGEPRWPTIDVPEVRSPLQI